MPIEGCRNNSRPFPGALSPDDIPAGLAAEYGYVNRVIPDDGIESFTDAFARRIAAFGKVAK